MLSIIRKQYFCIPTLQLTHSDSPCPAAYYSLIALDERATFWLQRTHPPTALCVSVLGDAYVALFAHMACM